MFSLVGDNKFDSAIPFLAIIILGIGFILGLFSTDACPVNTVISMIVPVAPRVAFPGLGQARIETNINYNLNLNKSKFKIPYNVLTMH